MKARDIIKQIKAKHPDAIILFNFNDCYRAFLEDAKKLEYNNIPKKFPSYKLDVYLPVLVRAGNKVGIYNGLNV